MPNPVNNESRIPFSLWKRVGVRGIALFYASALFMFPASAEAAAEKDEFPAMRIRHVTPPVPPGNVLLRAINGRRIRLSDFRGNAVLVEFLMTN
jgi:hypothetical protein